VRAHVRIAVGTALVVLAVALVNAHWWTGGGLPLLVTPIGASAVLMLAPAETPRPLAVLGGVTVSALIGVACAKAAPAWLACPIAAGLALLVMAALRCWHPPGTAVALAAIVGGEAIRRQGWEFILRPVLLDWGLLVVAATLFQRVWPHRGRAETAKTGGASHRVTSTRTATLSAETTAKRDARPPWPSGKPSRPEP
jgi:CBS domain-containing membrane protein